MKERNKIWPEKTIQIVVALIFISPAFFVQEEISIRILYIFLAGAIGWGIGKSLVRRKEEKKKKQIHISDHMISNYIFVYLSVYLFIYLKNAEYLRDNILSFLILVMVSTYFVLYVGLKEIQSKEAFIRLTKFEGKPAVILGIISVIIAIIILILTASFIG